MRPHQFAQLLDFQLRVELGPQIHEMQKGPQAEAHHKVLPIVKGKNAAGVFLGVAGPEQIPVALGGASAKFEILIAQIFGLGIFLALPIAVVPNGTEIKHLLELKGSVYCSADAFAGVAH